MDMFEDRKSAFYVKATKSGKMEVYMGKDEEGKPKIKITDYVVGTVKGITKQTSIWEGKAIPYWRIELQNGENTAFFNAGYSSGFARGLINSLCNAAIQDPVRIGCYMKGEYLQPSISQYNQLLRWKYDVMPKSDKVMVGTKEVYDDSKTIEWLTERVAEINSNAERAAEINSNVVLAFAPTEVKKVIKPQEQRPEPTQAELDALPF